MDTIGESVAVKRPVSATENLTIEGHVRGKIDLACHVLTIDPNGLVEAEVHARVVNILGKVEGDITATEAINIRETATVDGAVVAPSVGIEERASFRGNRHQPDYPTAEGHQTAQTGETTRAVP